VTESAREKVMKKKMDWSSKLSLLGLLMLLLIAAGAQEHRGKEPEPAPLVARTLPQPSQALDLTVGKSLLLDSNLAMERVSVGLG